MILAHRELRQNHVTDARSRGGVATNRPLSDRKRLVGAKLNYAPSFVPLSVLTRCSGLPARNDLLDQFSRAIDAGDVHIGRTTAEHGLERIRQLFGHQQSEGNSAKANRKRHLLRECR